MEDLRDIVVAHREGIPVHLRQIARVDEGSELRTGAPYRMPADLEAVR